MSQQIKLNFNNNLPATSVMLTRFDLDLGQGSWVSPDAAKNNDPVTVIYTDKASIVAAAESIREGLAGNIRIQIGSDGFATVNFQYYINDNKADVNGAASFTVGGAVVSVTSGTYDSNLNVDVSIDPAS